MAVGEIIAGAIQGTANAGIGIWNAYQDYQRFQYQKDLQKKLFEREDNSIQRRVADAEKAGFNKFSVIGEGSSAGSAVPVQAPHISEDLGSKVVDSLSTIYSLATQKAMAKKADTDSKLSDIAFKLGKNKLAESNMNLDLDRLEFLQGLGYDVDYDPQTRSWQYDPESVNTNYNSTPIGKISLNNFRLNQAQLEMREYENQYKWLGNILRVVRALNDTGNTVNSFRRRR